MKKSTWLVLTLAAAWIGGCGTHTSIGGNGGGGLSDGDAGIIGDAIIIVIDDAGLGPGDAIILGGQGGGGQGAGGQGAGGQGAGGQGGAIPGCGTGGQVGSASAATLSFLPAVDYAMHASALALGDLSGDGKVDIAVATDGGVGVLVNNGNGTFATAMSYPLPSSAPNSLVIGDLSGDGKADIVATSSTGVSVLVNRGNSVFAPATTYTVGINPISIALADINRDGKLDIVVANGGDGMSGDVAVLLNTGAGTFLAANYPAGVSPAAVAVADLNGDCRLDIAVADDRGGMSILFSSGDTFLTAKTFASSSFPRSIAIGDLNGDGRPDLAGTSGANGDLNVFLNYANGLFTAPVNYATVSGLPAASVVLGDLDGDGKSDLTVSYECCGVSIFLNRGDGTFPSPTEYVVASSPYALALGDLNGDGKNDLVLTSADGVSVRLNSSR